MAYDPQNIFARILRGELPAVKVYEDDQTLAFMDIMPMCEGHVLVIPKVAAETLFDLPPAAMQAVLMTAQRVGLAIQQALGFEGMATMQLNGAAAGQTVPHYHIHLLPSHIGQLQRHGGSGMASAETLEPVAARIRACLA